MRFTLIAILSVLFSHGLRAQAPTTIIRQSPVPVLQPSNYSTEFSITDANGKPFKSVDADVQGSAYFLDSLKSTVILLTNGNAILHIPARLDLYRQEIHVLSKNNEEFILPKELVRQLDFTDSSSARFQKYTFRSGFPPIDEQTVNTFYQVLTEGNITMLEFLRKKILERKNDVSGEITKQFETYEEYYVFSGNQIIKLKKNKDFVLSLMLTKEKEIQSYLAANKVNFKKWNDLQTLFSYYNSLGK